MRKILEQCPSCGGELAVTRLDCTACGTAISGRYSPCPFCRLSPENTRLLTAFVKARGNIREMERELGISYWTIRRLIDELTTELGFETRPAKQEETAVQVNEILEQVDRGELSAAEAAEILAQLRRPGSLES